jgi:hypothetical protein
MVPRTVPPPAAGNAMSMNGWNFSSKPNVPYQKSFIVKVQGMQWYLLGNGLFDEVTNPAYNARLLEKFYETHGTWDNFTFPHPHFGNLSCRFKDPLEIPDAIPSSGGLIEAFEVKLIHHDPGY